MHRVIAVIAATVLLASVISPVSATPRFHVRHHYLHHYPARHGHKGVHRFDRAWRINHAHRRHRAQRAPYRDGAVIGGRPRGCPSEYCGCGASLFLFGRIISALNVAANWLHFPHVPLFDARPHDAAVAPSRHHVLVLEQHIRGPLWRVHDSNSGHHLTRDHVRNIAGWTVVDPDARSGRA